MSVNRFKAFKSDRWVGLCKSAILSGLWLSCTHKSKLFVGCGLRGKKKTTLLVYNQYLLRVIISS